MREGGEMLLEFWLTFKNWGRGGMEVGNRLTVKDSKLQNLGI